MVSLLLYSFLASLLMGGAFFMYRIGRKAQRAETLEEATDDIHKASIVRNNLKSNPRSRKRLRKKYTR